MANLYTLYIQIYIHRLLIYIHKFGETPGNCFYDITSCDTLKIS